MSLTLHRAGQRGREDIEIDHAQRGSTILCFARQAVMRGRAKIARAAHAIAEARMHRTMIEADLYLNRYRHGSKNDDDLPIAASAPAEQPAPSVFPRVALRRAAGAVTEFARRVYPAVIVLSILATLVSATMAIRLAIWVPLYWH
jgi:hypothetical protein